jgi:hypothetical protein
MEEILLQLSRGCVAFIMGISSWVIIAAMMVRAVHDYKYIQIKLENYD